LLAPDARQSLLAEALERWPLPLFGASSRSPMRSTFRGTGKLSDPHSLFDMQVKRLHEHKHQHLNVLKLVTVYNRLRRSSGAAATPGTVIFGGKEGAPIPHGQADHQADQLHRAGHQSGPACLSGSQGGVPAGLQR
jgi:Carbohydrate phosphorylase